MSEVESSGSETAIQSGPLARLVVLELGEMVAAPYCAKLLGDLGADVVKIERPEGDPARLRGPFPGDAPDPERSALFVYLNTSKRSVRLDLETERDRRTFTELAARADVLVVGDFRGAKYACWSRIGPRARSKRSAAATRRSPPATRG